MLNNKLYFTPCAFACQTDTAAIQAAVEEAHRSDLRTVWIPAKENGAAWKLEKPVLLPDNTTVILDGSVVETEGIAFMNASSEDPATKSLGGEAHDLYIIGKNGAKIVGANAPQILLHNAKDYRIAGITFENGQGLKLVHARYGKVQQLGFSGCQYGVFLGEGCNNNLIADIEAKTEKEAVAFSGGETSIWGRSADIYDSSVCRVRAETAGAPAVAVHAGPVEVKNLFLRDITDTTAVPGVSVELGDASASLLQDISVRGVASKRTTASTSASCDGIYLGNLQGTAPTVNEAGTRILVEDAPMDIQLPQFRAENNAAFITPNDPAYYGATDAETIQNAVNAAAKQGVKLVLPRFNARMRQMRWDIEKAIRLPSNITVELWGAHLRQVDFTYDNMFLNADQANENITITGIGDAVLDSGKPNGLKLKTAGKLGFGPITANAMMLFQNVTGLVVENLHIAEARWYSIYCIYCAKGRISDIDLYAPPIFPDLGGIQLRSGCNDFLIENITGLSGEDMIIIGAQGFDDSTCAPAPGQSTDIQNIHIRNVKVNASRCYMVRLISHDSRRVSNIMIETLLDCSLPEQKKQPWATVGIGQTAGYCTRRGTMDELQNITIRDINGRSTRTVEIGGCSSNVSISNVHSFGNSEFAIQTGIRPAGSEFLAGTGGVELNAQTPSGEALPLAQVSGYRAGGLFFKCQQASRYMRGTATSIITDKKKFVGSVLGLTGLHTEDFVIENVLADRIGTGVTVTGNACVQIRNYQVADCGRELATCGSNCSLTIDGATVPLTITQKI